MRTIVLFAFSLFMLSQSVSANLVPYIFEDKATEDSELIWLYETILEFYEQKNVSQKLEIISSKKMLIVDLGQRTQDDGTTLNVLGFETGNLFLNIQAAMTNKTMEIRTTPGRLGHFTLWTTANGEEALYPFVIAPPLEGSIGDATQGVLFEMTPLGRLSVETIQSLKDHEQIQLAKQLREPNLLTDDDALIKLIDDLQHKPDLAAPLTAAQKKAAAQKQKMLDAMARQKNLMDKFRKKLNKKGFGKK